MPKLDDRIPAQDGNEGRQRQEHMERAKGTWVCAVPASPLEIVVGASGVLGRPD